MVEVLGVKREILFNNNYFQGFLPIAKKDFSNLIKSNFEFRVRNQELESDSSFKQMICYIFIVNPKEKKVFAYVRDKKLKEDGEYREARLHEKWSLGIGGHMEKSDMDGDFIENSIKRELTEEVIMEKYPQCKITGFINEDIDDVNKVHFGIACIAETLDEVKQNLEDEVREGRFYSVEEIEEIMNNESKSFEGWSEISWSFIKKYLENLK